MYVYTYIYIYVYTQQQYVYVYMCIERERERYIICIYCISYYILYVGGHERPAHRRGGVREGQRPRQTITYNKQETTQQISYNNSYTIL